jgi:hypothetical protein
VTSDTRRDALGCSSFHRDSRNLKQARGSCSYVNDQPKGEAPRAFLGIFDGSPEAVSEVRGDEAAELKRQDAMAAFVENVPLEGVDEIVEEIKP